MRIIGSLPHPNIKITLMHWNDRYMAKFEKYGTELIFKFREGPLMELQEDLHKLIDPDFIKDVETEFEQIKSIRVNAIKRQENKI